MEHAIPPYEERRLRGARLVLADPDAILWLGPDLILEDCELILGAAARGFAIAGLAMRGGCFRAERPLQNHRFDAARFEGVRFLGDFSSCDFGPLRPPTADLRPAIADCDFSDARLNLCELHGDELAGVRYPSWPGFRIEDPARAEAFIRTRSWPDALGRFLTVATQAPSAGDHPRAAVAAQDAEKWAARCAMTAEELQSRIAAIPGLIFGDQRSEPRPAPA